MHVFFSLLIPITHPISITGLKLNRSIAMVIFFSSTKLTVFDLLFEIFCLMSSCCCRAHNTNATYTLFTQSNVHGLRKQIHLCMFTISHSHVRIRSTASILTSTPSPLQNAHSIFSHSYESSRKKMQQRDLGLEIIFPNQAVQNFQPMGQLGKDRNQIHKPMSCIHSYETTFVH